MSTSLSGCTSVTYPNMGVTGLPQNANITCFNGFYYSAYYSYGAWNLVTSPNGVTWSSPVVMQGMQVTLSVFNNQLVCGYIDTSYTFHTMTTTDGTNWTTNTNSIPGIMLFKMEVFNDWLVVVGYQTNNVGIGLSYSTDGNTWFNNGTLIPQTAVNSLTNNSTSFYALALTAFNGSLYFLFQSVYGDATFPAINLASLASAATQFSIVPVPVLQQTGYYNASMVYCQDVLAIFFQDTNAATPSVRYVSSPDGVAWPTTPQTFQTIDPSSGPAGSINNDQLVFVSPIAWNQNITTNQIDNIGLFNVVMDPTDRNLPVLPTPAASTPVNVTNAANVAITSIYPPLTLTSSDTTVFLGKGSDGNYYLVSQSNDTDDMLDFTLPFEPGPLLQSGTTESWLAFACGTNVWVLDPLTTSAQYVFAQGGAATYMNPVSGSTNNEFLVQDETGMLYVVTITSGDGDMNFVTSGYQLASAGGVNLANDGTYVYAYSSAAQTFSLYQLATTDWGTPACSTIPVALNGMTALQAVSNGAYTMLYDPAQAVAAVVDLSMAASGSATVYCSLINT